MKIHGLILFSAVVTSVMCACSGAKSTDVVTPTIAVSIEPQRQMLECIAGDDYEVVTVLSKGSNPETFEPSMSQRAATASSEAYITIGAFPFEDAVAASVNDPHKIFDCSQGVERIYGTHSHHHPGDSHHHDGEPDPHIWSSATNAKIMASNMTDVLSQLNPGHKDVYKHRLDSLCGVIDSLDMQISSKINRSNSKAFAIWHPSLSYFARDYGLHQISVGEESKEISPRRMREVIEEAIADSVMVFFFQKEFDTRQAAGINERIGSRLIVIDPLAYDWMTQLSNIADELSSNE